MIFEAFTRVRLEPARSAEPPISSGNSGTSTSSAFCEALRVATVSAFDSDSLTSASARAPKSWGNPPAMRRRNSSASFGYWLSYAAKSFFQRRSAAAPCFFASQPAYTGCGMSNGG
jgi:hypothetical protein